jgi:hypothetical protein
MSGGALSKKKNNWRKNMTKNDLSKIKTNLQSFLKDYVIKSVTKKETLSVLIELSVDDIAKADLSKIYADTLEIVKKTLAAKKTEIVEDDVEIKILFELSF